MANVRLRQNMIIDAKFHVRGTVLDEKLIPQHLRDATHVDYDLENHEGRVLLLRDLSFQSLPRPSADGIPTSFPTHVAAGELIDLSQVPASKRQSLVEGLDYREKWTHQELEEMGRTQQDIYTQANPPETESVVPGQWGYK